MTVEHVAGIAVRNRQMLAFAGHYGVSVKTCVPADPASKGGAENTVKVAKADLVTTDANLLDGYPSFAALEATRAVFLSATGQILMPLDTAVESWSPNGRGEVRTAAAPTENPTCPSEPVLR